MTMTGRFTRSHLLCLFNAGLGSSFSITLDDALTTTDQDFV